MAETNNTRDLLATLRDALQELNSAAVRLIFSK